MGKKKSWQKVESEYKSRFKDYEFEFYWPSLRPFDPDDEAVDLIARASNQEYTGTLITPRFIDRMFKKNLETGECAGGSYFCMPRMVIVKRIDENTVKKTLDAMIEDTEFDIYFK